MPNIYARLTELEEWRKKTESNGGASPKLDTRLKALESRLEDCEEELDLEPAEPEEDEDEEDEDEEEEEEEEG